jgi:hypothetical protein
MKVPVGLRNLIHPALEGDGAVVVVGSSSQRSGKRSKPQRLCSMSISSKSALYPPRRGTTRISSGSTTVVGESVAEAAFVMEPTPALVMLLRLGVTVVSVSRSASGDGGGCDDDDTDLDKLRMDRRTSLVVTTVRGILIGRLVYSRLQQ